MATIALPGGDIPAGLQNFDSLPDSAYVDVIVGAALFGVHPGTMWRWAKTDPLLAPEKIGPNTTRFNVGKLRQKMRKAGQE